LKEKLEKAIKPQLKFPMEFPLKVIGENEEGFELLVLEILKRHVPDLDERGISQRLSSGGKYCSVSVSFIAKTRKQVDDLYIELTQNKKVKWVL
jgi:putative lipoic acid-binding regulatory protein